MRDVVYKWQCVRENKKIHKYVLNMLHLHVTSKGVCIHG